MARLWSNGFELNSSTAGVEYTASPISGATAATIQTTTKRSGGYAMRVTSIASGVAKGMAYQFKDTAAASHVYARIYVNIATLPSADNTIFSFGNGNTKLGTTLRIALSSTGTLKLMNNTTQIGSASSALSTGTWYRIEFEIDQTPAGGSQVLNAKLDGTSFASASNLSLALTTMAWMLVGMNLQQETQTTGDIYFDDIALNDNSGTAQNGFPGDGQIVHLHPNAAGDSNQLIRGDGAAASTSNYLVVKEVTPDDKVATTNYLKYAATTLVPVDDYANDTSATGGIGASDTITFVAVGTRIMGTSNSAAAGRQWQYHIKGSSGGTSSQSAVILSNSINTGTNSNVTTERNYRLHAYTNPDTATAWTTSTVDTMHIGAEGVAPANAGEKQISTIWALVEYVHSAATSVSITKSLQYAVRATPAAPTKSLKYTLKTTPTALTKSLQYSVYVPPTVALNSPADLGTASSTTPALSFTGTSPGAYDVEYEFELDTASTFDGLNVNEAFTRSNRDLDNDNGWLAYNSAGVQGTGRWAIVSNQAIPSVDVVYLERNTGPITLPLDVAWDSVHSGTGAAWDDSVYINVSAAGAPSGASGIIAHLARSDSNFPNSNITVYDGSTTVATKSTSFQFPSVGTVSCHLIINADGSGSLSVVGSGSDSLTWGARTWTNITGSYFMALGRTFADGTTQTNVIAKDNIVITRGPLLDKLSATPDATFTDLTNGADTHPFASGDLVQYAVQAGNALTVGTTYYWRVRAMSPSINSVWGAWSSTRSFTVASATPVSITKGLTYDVKATPSAVTKGLIYDVKTTPSALTKGLIYRVKTVPTALTKALAYTVESAPSAITKGLTYDVRTTAAAVTKALRYAVKTVPAALTKALQYAVKPTAAITKGIVYDIKITPAAITKGLIYDVKRTPSALTKSLQYAVKVAGGYSTVGVSLDGYWPFSDGSGSTVTDALGANNGTWGGTLGSQWGTGKIGSGGVFNGSDNVVDLGATPGHYGIAQPFSFSAWINPALNSADNYLIGNGTGFSDNNGWHARMTTTNRLRFILFNQAGNAYLGRDSSVLSAGWHHIVGVYNGNSAAPDIYVDGTLDNSASITGGSLTSINNTANLTIGQSQTAGHLLPFNGSIDEVGIWARALTSGDATSLYNSGTGLGYPFGLNGYLYKSLQYAMTAVTNVSITKGLVYDVKRTPAALTKSLSYYVKAPVAFTKALVYTVKAPAAALTKGVQYAVVRPLSTIKGLQYALKAPISLSKGVAYAVKTIPAASTKTLQYAVKAILALSKGAQYAVKTTPSAVTKALAYMVRSPALTKTLQYAIRTAAPITKATQYAVKPTVVVTKSIQYTVKAPASVTKSAQYAVKIPLSVTKSAQYAVRTTASAVTKAVTYRVAVATAITKAVAYAVKAPASITKGLAYAVRVQGSATKSVTYVVVSPVAITKGVTYDVKATPSAITKSLAYNIQGGATITKGVTYVVATSKRYWVGGTATWDNTAGSKWSYSSGGTAGATSPTATEDAIFDAASGAVTVTTGATLAVKDLNTTGFTGTIAGSNTLNIWGNLWRIGTGTTWSKTGATRLFGTGTVYIDTNGKAIAGSMTLDDNSGGTAGFFELQSDFNQTASGGFAITRGSFKTNNYTMHTSGMSISSLNGGAIDFGTSTIYSAGAFNLGTATGLSSMASTGLTVRMEGLSSLTFTGGGFHYLKVYFNPTNHIGSIFNSNTFDTLELAPATSLFVRFGTTQTIGNLIATGSAGNVITIQSDSSGSPHYLVYSGTLGYISGDYLAIKDSQASPANTWYAGANSTDNGGNAGWIFTPPRFTLTKSIAYSVKPSISITKGLQYVVTTPASITKSLRYSVAVAGAITKSLAYAVKSPTALTASLQYVLIVTTPTQRTLSAKYAVLTQGVVTKGVSYAVKTAASLTKALSYAVSRATSLSKGAQYSVRTSSAVTKGLAYMVRSPAITKALTYAVRTVAPITKSAQYAVRPTTAIARSLAYAVRTTGAALTKTVAYAVVKSQATTKALQYAVLSATSLTKSLRYAILPSNTAIKSLQYAVRASATLTQALSYRVGTVGAITKAARYEVATQAAITKSLRYSVVGPTLQKALSYVVLTVGAVTKALRYEVLTAGAIQKGLRYAVKPTAAITKTAKYEVRAVLSLQKTLAYAVKASPNALQAPLRYVVVAPSHITKGATYRVHTAVSTSLTATYAVRGAAAIQKSLTYHIVIVTPTAIAKPLCYVVVAPHAPILKSLTYVMRVYPYHKKKPSPYAKQDSPYTSKPSPYSGKATPYTHKATPYTHL